jgi:RNA polymerase sigma-70 factor (ECF subfamily)
MEAITMFDTYTDSAIDAENRPSSFGDDAGETKRRLVRTELAYCYQRYRTVATQRLRDEIVADDVMQAFALKALEHFEQLRDAKAVQAWLRRLFEATLIDLGTRCQRDVASGRPNAAEL